MSLVSNSLDNAKSQSNSASKGNIASALIAFALGVAVLYSVGFAETAALHDAAHDSRHSAGFPCH